MSFLGNHFFVVIILGILGITNGYMNVTCIVKGRKLIQTVCPLFVCFEVFRPSQPNGVMSSAVSLPNHTFTGQA